MLTTGRERTFAEFARQLPGTLATGLAIAVTTLWTYWGFGEMYHEGWWGAWTNRLPYLIPGSVCLLLTLLALAWPTLGGCLIVLLGIAFATFFGRGVAIIGVAIVVFGLLFVVAGILARRDGTGTGPGPSARPWWRRKLTRLLAAGIPLLTGVGISFYMLPIVLTRVDDGNRSARLIEGNGVALVWAPEGPGWNWKQPWGGYPSWHSLALYGVPPVGLEAGKPGYGRLEDGYAFATSEDMAATNLCRYLNADGQSLSSEPRDIWRMPTTDEVVRSLVRHGQNAGCMWDGEVGRQATCAVRPDKESPLWRTDQPVIYMWTADANSKERGAFVSYNGFVNATRKSGGNPRHGYRCVREP